MEKERRFETKNIKKADLKTDILKKIPFNYCDRWCERCGHKENCRVYQEDTAIRFDHIAKGEDPDDPEIFFQDIKERFNAVTNLLRKDFKKAKTNSKRMKKSAKEEMIMENKIEFKAIRSSLYKQANSFVSETNFFLKKFFAEYESSADDFINFEKTIEELNWYRSLFLVKIHRALIDQIWAESVKDIKEKEYNLEDANLSGKLSYASLFVCRRCLAKLSRECLGFRKWARDLSISAKNLLEKIETKFPEMHKAKIIFHS